MVPSPSSTTARSNTTVNGEGNDTTIDTDSTTIPSTSSSSSLSPNNHNRNNNNHNKTNTKTTVTMSSPQQQQQHEQQLRRGDLVRVADRGSQTSKRFQNRQGHLGRIVLCKEGDAAVADDTAATTTTYDVEWVLGGHSKNVLRHELVYTNAEQEGMIASTTSMSSGAALEGHHHHHGSRTKRKPIDYMSETIQKDAIKQQQRKKLKLQQQLEEVEAATATAPTTTPTPKKSIHRNNYRLPSSNARSASTGSSNHRTSSSPSSSTTVKKRKLPTSLSSKKMNATVSFVDEEQPQESQTTMIKKKNDTTATTGTTQKGNQQRRVSIGATTATKRGDIKTSNGKKSAAELSTTMKSQKKKNLPTTTSTKKGQRKTIFTYTTTSASKHDATSSSIAISPTTTNIDNTHSSTTIPSKSSATSNFLPSLPSQEQQLELAASNNSSNNKTTPTAATTTLSSSLQQQLQQLDLYEKHRREFDRICTRLMNKIDYFHHFWKKNQNDDDIAAMMTSTVDSQNHERIDVSSHLGDHLDVANSNNNDPTNLMASKRRIVVTPDANTSPSTSDDFITNIHNSNHINTKTISLRHNEDHDKAVSSSPLLPPPLNWDMIVQRIQDGRYVLDRIKQEESERKKVFGASFNDPSIINNNNDANSSKNEQQQASSSTNSYRVLNRKGVNWELFRLDVFAMCDTVLTFRNEQREKRRKEQPQELPTAKGIDQKHNDESENCDKNNVNGVVEDDDDEDDDHGQRGSISYSVKKIKEATQIAVDRTGRRHEYEMKFADDRYKFTQAIESCNNKEAAMQSWRKIPYPERIYERLKADVVCAGLSKLDEKIAAFELKTSLPDSFIGQSYRYDDTGQSEAWMKSVVDETGCNASSSKVPSRRRSSNASGASNTDDSQKAEKERVAALALAADEGVTRAQVSATMQSLLIAVQDRVMTEWNVLRQPELRSANWMTDSASSIQIHDNMKTNLNDPSYQQKPHTDDLPPEIIEQPVWGIDCYTRRNIMSCLETEFSTNTSLVFIEKWLLPAINACPEDLGHDISNAARILEGVPLVEVSGNVEVDDPDASNSNGNTEFTHPYSEIERKLNDSLLGRSLLQKIAASGPLWLKAAANQLRRAREALGPNFFRVHPKGNGSVVLSSTLKPNTLVTFYRGELYPSWRWGEKMDAIDITQSRKDLKPALPDFYNMALERPQSDPRGYGLLFVDASRKAGHGSSLSHSCAPTCEVRVAACEGELCLAMTTLRELEMGEELTFDYNAVTESLNEYRSAVCLCGYGKCRGSFLHFATADCYQQVLNRNSPIASRFSSLVKGSMKQVMSPDDEQIQRNHGFLTAAFGAISVNRRAAALDGIGESLVDSLNMVPVWLRTYVADTLRYIEYERRALPIALICEHLSNSRSGQDDNVVTNDVEEPNIVEEPAKERKHVSSFFYFLKTESEFLRDLMKKEGFPESLKGLQLRHAIQKVAANYWSDLPDETKKYWKDEAQADFDRKMKTGHTSAKKISDSSEGKKKTPEVKKAEKGKSKLEIQDILHTSKISFQDADAEGVVAMEQRIQQLTQTLSRVGRVLDRHREAMIERNPEQNVDAESMQKLVHAPLRVLTDTEVVDWMWKQTDGVVLSFLRHVQLSRFVRPTFAHSLQEIYDEFSSEEFKRHQLKEALLTLRSAVLQELKVMAKEVKQLRLQANVQQTDDMDIQSSDSDNEGNTHVDMALSNRSLDLQKGDFVDQQVGECRNESPQWLDFYSERFVLQASADLLLMYAHTSNFFVFQPYVPLESTPVEVYARELGNSVPRSVIDNGLSVDESENGKAGTMASMTSDLLSLKSAAASNDDRLDIEASPDADKNQEGEKLCAPDDIVAKVSIKYDGHYVPSQLLQWYNAGIGQKQGLPNLLGCVLLPRIADCWSSDLLRTNKRTRGDGRTNYETKIRPRLVEWMQDPYERGNPWPVEVARAFVPDETNRDTKNSLGSFVAYGSPIIDFLVMGDESNIIDVLYELDADDKVATKKSADGLLTSVDKGRPAQAVSTWVQCENPSCMKWRKIPWYVDADLLPERFYCKDNEWNPTGNTCDSPEDDWDKDDAMVGSDGKVEGSPVNKKKFEGRLPVNEESSFRIGTRFDVQRSDKNVYSIATVIKVDFSGSIKRIMFHFAKTSSDRDEWVEFGSPRIAPLFTKVIQKRETLDVKVVPAKLDMTTNQAKTNKKKRPKSSNFIEHRFSEKLSDDGSPSKKQKLNDGKSPQQSRTVKVKPKADPTDERSFVTGAKFDVYREDKKRFYWAVVVDVDFNSETKKVCFRFTKTKDNHTQWVEFGSPNICVYKSKLLPKDLPKIDSSKIADKEPTRKEPKNASETNKDIVDPEPPPKIADPSDFSTFYVGALFDVYRYDKKRYHRASVLYLDSDGVDKRVCFRFKDGHEEWITFGSKAICRFKSKLKRSVPKPTTTPVLDLTTNEDDEKLDSKHVDSTMKKRALIPANEPILDLTTREGDSEEKCEKNIETYPLANHESFPLSQCTDDLGIRHENGMAKSDRKVKTVSRKMKGPSDPASEKSFTIGARFDVYREDKDRYYWAVVEDVDFNESFRRILFRFTRSKDNHIEWIEFGSPRICRYKTKVISKRPQPKEPDLVVAPTISSSTSNSEERQTCTVMGSGYDDIKVSQYESAMVPMNQDHSNTSYDAFLDHHDDNGNGNNPLRSRSNIYNDNGKGNRETESQCAASSTANTSGIGNGLYNYYTNASKTNQRSVPLPFRPPDIVAPASATSFVVEKHPLPNEQTVVTMKDSNSNGYANANVQSTPAPRLFSSATTGMQQQSPSFRSASTIPSGLSGLDMLAAVSFDAVAATNTTAAAEQKFIGWDGVGNNNNNTIHRNGEQTQSWTNSTIASSAGWAGMGHDTKMVAPSYNNQLTGHNNNGEQLQDHQPPWPQQQQRWMTSYGTHHQLQQQQQAQQYPGSFLHPQMGSTATTTATWNQSQSSIPFAGLYQRQQQIAVEQNLISNQCHLSHKNNNSNRKGNGT